MYIVEHRASVQSRIGVLFECPIVTNYRTFVDDMYKVLEFAEWKRKSNDLCSDDIFATWNV